MDGSGRDGSPSRPSKDSTEKRDASSVLRRPRIFAAYWESAFAGAFGS